MNRSLRNLALLGLLALGASTAGAQTLFNVKYEPSILTLTITPTSAAPSGNLPAGNETHSFSLGYGLLFKNLFSSYPTNIVPDQGSGLIAGTVGGDGIKAFTQNNPSGVINTVYDEANGGRGLSLLSNQSGLMYFDRDVQAFSTSGANNGAITITFGSSAANAYFSTTSSPVAGMVNVGAGSSSYDIGSYSYTYSAVPEPSTYAAIAGALGLGYAVYRRRRQAAAASA